MRRSEALAMAALGGLFGSLVSGGLVYWLTRSAAGEPGKAAAEVNDPGAETSSIEQRLQALERSAGAPRAPRRVVLATGSASPPGSTGPLGAAPGEASAAGGGDPVVDNPVFEAAVRDLVDRIEEERQSERELERAERSRQWAEQWANDLRDPLKLSDAQKAKLQEIASQFWDRLREARRGDAGLPGSREERRARLNALRDEAEAKLAEVLDGSQMSTYRGLDEEQRLGARFGRDRRRSD